MLKIFRDNLKYLSWILWLVIFVFVLFVFVDFGGTVQRGSLPNEAAATVGAMEISYREFERSYRQAETAYRQAYGPEFTSETAAQLGLPLQVLNQLVGERILQAEAGRMGVTVTDEEVRRAIVEMPELQRDGKFIGREAYQQLLKANRLSADQFHEALRQELLVDKVRAVLQASIFVPDEEIETAYREEADTVAMRWVGVPARRFTEVASVEPAAVEAYFAAHRDELRFPERRVVRYLLVAPAELRAAAAVGDEELRRAYDADPTAYERPEQVRARHILLRTGPERSAAEAEELAADLRRRVEAGESFAALAEEYSDDPGSKANGGDLGFFGRGEMVPAFEAAAFGAEPGTLVGPVKTDFGVHLLAVEERRPAGRQPFEEVADELRQRLLGERAEAAAEAKAKELAASLAGKRPDAAAFAAAAEGETGVSVVTTEPFGRDDDVPGIGPATRFSAVAFELAAGEVSEPVRTARGWTVLQVAEIEEPRLPELAEVRQQVERAALEARRLELARGVAEQVRAAIAAGRSLDEVAAEFDLEVREAGPLGRRGTIPGLGSAAAVIDAALALDAGAVGGPIAAGDRVVVFEVTARNRFDPAVFAAQREATRQRLTQERLGELLASVIAQRREELAVQVDPQLLENFGLAGS